MPLEETNRVDKLEVDDDRYKVQLAATYTQANQSAAQVVVDGAPGVGARIMWISCWTLKGDTFTDTKGCQVRIRKARGTGEEWAIIDLGLFHTVCVDVTTCRSIRVEVVANQIAAAANANVSARFSRSDRQNDTTSRAWFCRSYVTPAAVQQIPTGAVEVMSLNAGGDGGFQFFLMDQAGVMQPVPLALVQSVPVDVRGTHFQPSVNGGLLAWKIQL